MLNNLFNIFKNMYYVYCITTKNLEKDNTYKIGYSSTLSGRKGNFDDSTINIENWYYIDSIAVNDKENASKLEHKIHKYFDDKRLSKNREFFKIEDKSEITNLFNKIKNMKTEKIEDGPIKRTGESISNLIKTIELYGENLAWIITEKIDNAKAANAENMWIRIENEGKKIVYKDDGDGFTANQLKQFAKNDTYHYNDNGVGIRGMGGKDSDRANSDYKNAEGGESIVKYTSSTDGIHQNIMKWPICENVKKYENPDVYTNIIPESGKCHKGTIIEHEDVHQITKEKWQDARKYIRYVCSLYNMNIYVSKWLTGHNGYELLSGYFDPLYTNRIDLSKNGIIAHNDGSCHKIINKTFFNYETGKKFKVKIVSFYMSTEKLNQLEDIEKDFGASSEWCGVYFLYNNRYLSKPQTLKLQHGYNRTRIGVFLEDSETAKIFNIKSVKNQGINYEDNYNLANFVDDDGKNFSEIIRTEMAYWVRFDDRQRDLRNVENLGYIEAIKKTAEVLEDYSGVLFADVVDADNFDSIDTKKGKKHSSTVHKEKAEELEEAIKRFDSLDEEKKKDLLTKYQYCVSYGSFKLKRTQHIKCSELKDFNTEIDIMPWSIHNEVLAGENELNRLYLFLKDKERKNGSTIVEKMDKYIENAYNIIN